MIHNLIRVRHQMIFSSCQQSCASKSFSFQLWMNSMLSHSHACVFHYCLYAKSQSMEDSAESKIYNLRDTTTNWRLLNTAIPTRVYVMCSHKQIHTHSLHVSTERLKRIQQKPKKTRSESSKFATGRFTYVMWCLLKDQNATVLANDIERNAIHIFFL